MSKGSKAAVGRRIASDDVFHAPRCRLLGRLAARPTGRAVAVHTRPRLLRRGLESSKAVRRFTLQ